MKTIVINLLGGPGSGKSTTSADLYKEFKMQGYSVELVREVVKELAYAGIKPKPLAHLGSNVFCCAKLGLKIVKNENTRYSYGIHT